MRLLTSNKIQGGFQNKIYSKLFEILVWLIIKSSISNLNGIKLKISSPWIGDFPFHLTGRNTLPVIFDVPRRSIQFSELLEKFLRYNGKLLLICRPPHSIFDVESLKILHEIYNIKGPTIERVKYKLKSAAISHKPMIDLIYRLVNISGGNFQVRYNDYLHAKMIITDAYAIMGSSNVTYSGMYGNDEVNIFSSDKIFISNLNNLFDSLWATSIDIRDYKEHKRYRELNRILKYLASMDPDFKLLMFKLNRIHNV